ncbi:MAG: pyruvate, phosphate dikinase [Acidimicrobiia bacterium]
MTEYVYALDHPHGLPPQDVAAIVGGKAAGLSVMATELGLPVPPGCVISTAACREYLNGSWPSELDGEIQDHIARVEGSVGRRFGDPADPLIVSVRSGAPVSMPGMMDTILNLGLNDATTDGLTALTGDRRFVDACRDRFTASYRDIVGADEVPDDPWEQLREAIEAVFRSWNSDRARSYRAQEGISDDLGTGVIVQTMVFGNRGADSATGVVFTRDPATGENSLYGDVMFDAQGEDVVAGTHQPEPIAALAERMPSIAEELSRYAATLEHHYADVCDIEFTIEQGRLWMLQTRIGKRSAQAAVRIAVEMAEDESFPLSRAEAVARTARYLSEPPTMAAYSTATSAAAAGLGASPGVVSGEIATTPEAAVTIAESGRDVILVRRQTSPEDVHAMARAVGILTSTGGLASHAAVVARGWGIPAVVGAAAVRIDGGLVSIGDQELTVGDVLTIDGGSGDVYVGAVATGAEMVPEAATLLGWAEELGIDIAKPTAPADSVAAKNATDPADAVGEPRAPEADDVTRALLIKGFAMPNDFAAAFFSSADEIVAVLDGMVADGVAELVGGMFQLTADGKALGSERMAADRERWGADEATAALDAFLPLDQQMKDVVTSWQMREFNGQQVINDHLDEAHDAAVLAKFVGLHGDAGPWVAALSDGLPRLGRYGDRLERAAAMVVDGDHRYIASPLVDSYHGVWFELHEDLILLAGRTRADEVSSGRA